MRINRNHPLVREVVLLQQALEGKSRFAQVRADQLRHLPKPLVKEAMGVVGMRVERGHRKDDPLLPLTSADERKVERVRRKLARFLYKSLR